MSGLPCQSFWARALCQLGALSAAGCGGSGQTFVDVNLNAHAHRYDHPRRRRWRQRYRWPLVLGDAQRRAPGRKRVCGRGGDLHRRLGLLLGPLRHGHGEVRAGHRSMRGGWRLVHVAHRLL